MIEGMINIIKKMLSILTLSTTAVAPINTENTNHIADAGKKAKSFIWSNGNSNEKI